MLADHSIRKSTITPIRFRGVITDTKKKIGSEQEECQSRNLVSLYILRLAYKSGIYMMMMLK